MRTERLTALQDDGNKKVAVLAMLTSFALILGYIESLIPLNFGIPGIKPGLCNIVILLTLLLYSWREAVLVSAVRILAVGFLFGNAFSILYSLAGGLLSIIIMAFLIRAGAFGLIGISASGGAVHGIGQLIVAKIVLPSLPFAGYAAVLTVSGVVTGSLVGLITHEIYKRTIAVYKKDN